MDGEGQYFVENVQRFAYTIAGEAAGNGQQTLQVLVDLIFVHACDALKSTYKSKLQQRS